MASECLMPPKLFNKKAPANKWSGLFFLPFNLEQCSLCRVCKVPFLLGHFTLAGDAFTVAGAILKQVESVWCESEFILRNRQGFAPFHNRVNRQNTQAPSNWSVRACR